MYFPLGELVLLREWRAELTVLEMEAGNDLSLLSPQVAERDLELQQRSRCAHSAI
jgi:hypothetical protein